MGRRVARAAGLGLLFSLLLGASDPAPPGPPVPETVLPSAGRFLVATERIRGSIFRQSVVYLVNYADSGALGLIVNRPTDVALHEVVEGAVDGSGTLYAGGPVKRNAVMMLLRADVPPERAAHVAGDVFVSVDPGMLLEHTASLDAGRLRVYAGYAGWGPGQLDREIARGDWLVVRAPTASIFEGDPADLWKRLFRQHHRLLTRAPAPAGARG